MSLEDLSPRRFMALTEAYARRYTLTRRSALAGLAAAAAAPRMALAQTPKRGGALRVGRDQEPDTLDPHKTSLAVANATMSMIYEPLARRDADGKVAPALAEGWEFRDNNRTIVFHLRKGVTFHDGAPCDAAACAFTVNRMLDKATACPTVFLLGPLDSVEVIDPLTVAYKFKQPFVPMWVGLTLAYCGILPPGAVQKLGVGFGRSPVGAGPFKFTSWSPDGGIKFARNDAYTCGPVAWLDSVQLTQYPEDATRVAALQSGEINAIFNGQSVPLDRVRSLKSDSEMHLEQRVSQSTRALCFNQSLKPMDDLRVRQAICHGVDPTRVIALALDGNASVAYGGLASAIPGYDKRVEQLAYKYDPAKTEELLAAAGIKPGTELKLICNDTPSVRRSAEIVQAQLKDVGLDISIQSMPIGQVVVQSKKKEHHIYFYTYAYPDADALYVIFNSKSALYRDYADDPDIDAWTDQSRVEFDDAKRQALYDKVQERLVEQAHWAPLFEPLNFAAFDQSVQGGALRSDGDVDVTKIWLST